MERLVAFDFDGVLVDAREEIVPAATKTFNELCSGSLELEKSMAEFVKSRHLIRTGRDVMPVMHFIARGKDMSLMGRGEIVGLKKNWGEEKVIEMEKEYFERKAGQRTDVKKWASLIKPFPGAFKAFRATLEQEKTVIATTRSKNAILAYFKEKSIDFPREKVYDWGVSHDKTEQFRQISRIEKIPFKKMVFIEDVVLNAMAVRQLGVKVLLSTWGFSSKGQWREGEEKGIVVVKSGEVLLSEIRKALNSIKE